MSSPNIPNDDEIKKLQELFEKLGEQFQKDRTDLEQISIERETYLNFLNRRQTINDVFPKREELNFGHDFQGDDFLLPLKESIHDYYSQKKLIDTKYQIDLFNEQLKTLVEQLDVKASNQNLVNPVHRKRNPLKIDLSYPSSYQSQFIERISHLRRKAYLEINRKLREMDANDFEKNLSEIEEFMKE